MTEFFRWILALVTSVSVLWTTDARARTPIERDLADFAIASCLTKVDSPVLREQGQLWAGAIAQRSHGKIEIFQKVADVVFLDLEETGVAVGHGDNPTSDANRPMPMLTCGEIVDRPVVLKAIGKAKASLRRAYRAGS